jgi:hypothetical protein
MTVANACVLICHVADMPEYGRICAVTETSNVKMLEIGEN